MLASFATALRYSFGMIELANKLEAAIVAMLDDGLRTGDIAQGGPSVGTQEMGAAILK
jgi:3-isopropylmalate dehydrogenase